MANQRDKQPSQRAQRQPQTGTSANVQADENLAGNKPRPSRRNQAAAQANIQARNHTRKQTPRK